MIKYLILIVKISDVIEKDEKISDDNTLCAMALLLCIPKHLTKDLAINQRRDF